MAFVVQINDIHDLEPWQAIILTDTMTQTEKEMVVIAISGGSALLSDGTVLTNCNEDCNRIILKDEFHRDCELTDEVRDLLAETGTYAGMKA